MDAETKRTVTMAGKEMEILFDVNCLWECTKDIRLALPSIVSQLCKILLQKEIANCLISEVAVGERVVLLDKEAHRSYRLERREHAIYVLGLYEELLVDSSAMSLVYMPTGKLLQLFPITKKKAA